MPLKVGLVQATSYRGSTTPGELELNLDLLPDIADRHVLIVDDIFDTGHTLAALVEKFTGPRPGPIALGRALAQGGTRGSAVQPDHVGVRDSRTSSSSAMGWIMPTLYRNLPHVAALEPADLAPQDGKSNRPRRSQGTSAHDRRVMAGPRIGQPRAAEYYGVRGEWPVTLRILHIIPTLDRSGAEKQLTLLAAGLPRDEFDVHVCA